MLGKKKEGGVFEGGWYPNAHYAYPQVCEELENLFEVMGLVIVS